MKLRPAILQFFTLPPPVRLGAVILATLLLGLMAGCSTTGAQSIKDDLKNRIACTAAKDKAYFLSLYWRFGISAEVDEADAKAICGK